MFVQGVKEPSTEDAFGIHVVCSVFRVWFGVEHLVFVWLFRLDVQGVKQEQK